MILKDQIPLDEVVSTHQTALERLPSHRARRRRSIVAMVVTCPILIALLIDEPLQYRLVVAGVFAVTIGLLYPWYYRSVLQRNLRRHLVEVNGSEGPFDVNYKIDSDRIEVEQSETALLFSWTKLVECNEGENAIDLAFEKGGFVRIAHRAFETDEQRRAFLSLVNSSQTN